MKLNPRTGVIEHGHSRHRLSLLQPSNRSKKAPLVPKSILEIAEKIGHIIGQQIVEALKNIQQAPVVSAPVVPDIEPVINIPSCWTVDPDYIQPETTITVSPAKKDELSYMTPITIDESVLDVGIGDIKELKKGEGSATLAKQEVKTDKGLTESKSKLAALKRIDRS